MGWKLSNIQDKVRALTGRASTNQLSDTDLTTYINQYYQYVLPADLKPLELETWWEFDTTDGDETQVLDDDSYVVISSPAYADGYDVELYFDAERFYAKWPEHTTYDENIPTDALFYGQTLLLRPTPDTAYSMKIKAWTRPAALASSTSTPTLEGWGTIDSLWNCDGDFRR